MSKILKKLLAVAFISICLELYAGFPNLNLFDPYDILLLAPKWPETNYQFTITYEGLLKERAFQADDNELTLSSNEGFRKRRDFLQLWENCQDALAALKGVDFDCPAGEFAQQFNIDDDNGTHGHFIPCGDLRVNNIMLAGEYHFPHNVSFWGFLPIVSAELKNVTWREKNSGIFFEDTIVTNFISTLEKLGCMNLRGWKRFGIGDMVGLVTWYGYYPQFKPHLRNVRLNIRGGLTVPTGKKADQDKLFAFPFGYDASFGILAAGNIELWLRDYVHVGIDAQFLHLFGTTRNRRIKTDMAQTDFFFLTKVRTFKEFGFTQHYTLYLEFSHFWRGFSLLAAYQHTKHQDDKLFLCSDHFDAELANTAESLQEWSLHNVILQAKYDCFTGANNPRFKPYLSLLYKHGFNGKRAVLADTLALQLSVSF